MSFIGIDIGASFIKGAVLNTESLLIEHVIRAPFPPLISNLPPLYREVNTRDIMKSVDEILKQLLFPNCEGIIMCGQMGGFVFTNNCGEPFSNYISWQDQRTYRKMRKIEYLGNEFKPSFPVLCWLAERSMLPSGTMPIPVTDFVIANLCNCIPRIEPTNASTYGIYNLVSQKWDYKVISKLGLKDLRLPEICQFGEVVGKYNGIPCYISVGDQQCALFGSLLKEGELSLNIATGCQVSMISKLEFGDYQTRPYFGKYIKTITHIPAGRSLNNLLRLMTDGEKSWDYINKVASEVSKTDLKVNLSFFESACGQFGEITNMREDNMTIGHIFRAALENISDNCYQSALRISKKQEWTDLVFSGGLAHNVGSLKKIIQQKFDTDCRIATVEDTLNGLLIMAQRIGGKR